MTMKRLGLAVLAWGVPWLLILAVVKLGSEIADRMP